ncbi:hypothetical protein RJ641_016250 [Dillenia turbinata]|uniref:Uncharacterized protein n=1 Tax=Dillenia turbinata TaxID=194707 RepID=A0AAN8UYH8_9MAGN
MNGQVGQHGAFVFMISTTAGGVGLNLAVADTLFHVLMIRESGVMGDCLMHFPDFLPASLMHINELPKDDDCNVSQWVGLAVLQSYNPRRKVPCGDISIPDLECCLAKAAFSAAQNSGIIFDVHPEIFRGLGSYPTFAASDTAMKMPQEQDLYAGGSS